MIALPQGVIRARLEGRIHFFLVREIHWAPVITAMGGDAEIYILPSGNYPQASALEAQKFWLRLERSLHHKHSSRN